MELRKPLIDFIISELNGIILALQINQAMMDNEAFEEAKKEAISKDSMTLEEVDNLIREYDIHKKNIEEIHIRVDKLRGEYDAYQKIIKFIESLNNGE